MITDKDKKWHYIFVKRLSASFNGITSNHDGSFYCSNCFYSFRTENALKKHERVNEHTHSGYSLLHTYCSFDNTKDKLSYYRGQDCMKMLCKELKEHTKRIIYYKTNK